MIPSLVRKATYTREDYPFVYYSSLLEQFGIIDYANKETPLMDMEGNFYTETELDSLMPLFSFRQLASEGKLPDSIKGHEISQQILRINQVVYRYNPKEVKKPDPGLYILFESMPKRVGLEIPPDVFRLKNDIEFIDAETNRTDAGKSERFRKALDKAGFQFPAQWAIGNPNPRKAYDEGYFSLDAKGDFYHIKMVNNRPYVRNTGIGEKLDIASFSIYEAATKRFYGFLFDKSGYMYIVESNEEGGYKPLRLEMDPIDLENEQVSLMGNLLYWTVNVSSATGRKYYALEATTLNQVSRHFIARQPGGWDKASRCLFPVYLTFEQANSSYIAPRLHFTGWCGFLANAVAVAVYLIFGLGCRKKKAAISLYILITGIAGLLAVVILPGFRKK